MVYEVLNLNYLKIVIIPFLEKYNYLSARKTELLPFKTIVEKMSAKEHSNTNTKGLKDIINIVFKSKLNGKKSKAALLPFIVIVNILKKNYIVLSKIYNFIKDL
jgi:hypothetical protein